jgi:hypothetical protein
MNEKPIVTVHMDNIFAYDDLDRRLLRHQQKRGPLTDEQLARARYIVSGFHRADCWHWIPVRRMARYIISGSPLPTAPPRPGTPG